MYLEGVKDGARLLRLVKKACRKKPVIIWKAGLTSAGSRAAASHTASLAGLARMWQAFFAQSDAIPVFSLEEMAELVMTFLYVKPLKGNRVGLVAFGGGASVAAADVCSQEGLEVPALGQHTIDALKEFVSLAGASIMNPLDTGLAFRNITVLQREIELVAADPSIDMVIVMPHLDVVRKANPEQVDDLIKYLSDIAVNGQDGKAVVLVFQSFSNSEWEGEMRSRLLLELPRKGVAVYQSLKAASRSLSRYSRYSN
jgi:acetyl-CoA synthetase (ADP-forming)